MDRVKGEHFATSKRIDAALRAEAKHGRCLLSTPQTSKALLKRTKSGTIHSPRRGMFVDADLWSTLSVRDRHLFVARTIAPRISPNIFCGVTAAFAYGLSVTTASAFGTDTKTIAVAGNGGAHGCKYAGIRWYPLGSDHPWKADGLDVTSPGRTVFDCARRLSFPDGLAIADSALRAGLLDRASLLRLIASGRGMKGIARAQLVCAHMDARAESGGESIVRARMIELGYATPELQISIISPLDQRQAYRIDMLSHRPDGTCVAIELDGRQKYEDTSMLRGGDLITTLLDERQREAAITACGIEVMRLRWRDLLDDKRLCHIMDAYRIPRS